MRFGGLFDCVKPKIHGLAFLVYDDLKSETVSTGSAIYFDPIYNLDFLKASL